MKFNKDNCKNWKRINPGTLHARGHPAGKQLGILVDTRLSIKQQCALVAKWATNLRRGPGPTFEKYEKSTLFFLTDCIAEEIYKQVFCAGKHLNCMYIYDRAG